MSYGLRKMGDMFSDKEAALDMAASLMHLVELLAKRHDIPFLAVFQPNENWLSHFHHFPENATGSELRAAWYEIAGETS